MPPPDTTRRTIPRRRAIQTLTLAVLMLAGVRLGAAPRPGAGEYAVKATFLWNFTRFVEWPATAFTTPASPFVVGVLGKDPFGSNLAEVFKGETVQDHPVRLKAMKDGDDLKQCHILFIAASEKERAGELLAKMKGAPVLTVSEMDRFGQRGGLVNFYKDGGVTKFEINLNALKATGFNAKAQLLRLARIVGSDTKD